MSSSGTPLFGNFLSIQPPTKSPKSPKGTIIENPLMKNAQFSYGGSALTTHRTSSTLQTIPPRSPLIAVTPNRDNLRHRQEDYKSRTSQIATPGPPPRMSLSLMGGMAMPMQTKHDIAKEPQMKQQKQRFDTLKSPAAVSTPIPVASPRLLEKKSETTNYFRESSSSFSSESLVADHWVVAHGYTSSNEYKELLGILSSYGTIQSQEAGGNWLAVLYASRLSAEKALCCQPILLSNTLCGMTRGTPSLLQSLSSGKGEKQQQDTMMQGDEKSAGASRNDSKRAESGGTIDERDILMLENSAYESRKPYQPKSICDKVFAWYFGWEEHLHSD